MDTTWHGYTDGQRRANLSVLRTALTCEARYDGRDVPPTLANLRHVLHSSASLHARQEVMKQPSQEVKPGQARYLLLELQDLPSRRRQEPINRAVACAILTTGRGREGGGAESGDQSKRSFHDRVGKVKLGYDRRCLCGSSKPRRPRTRPSGQEWQTALAPWPNCVLVQLLID